ncbi:Annexin D3 [Vitis vinifera]|uniref:Annexin D3 n=1 Tax=Vitis vinifera TaxID=29760 RepID=A0A438BTT3_VITVI|nr:Annexin D3 [Vitis vinifera]
MESKGSRSKTLINSFIKSPSSIVFNLNFLVCSSPRKGCDIGKQCLEKEEEENKSVAGIGRDSMCIIPGPSNGSEAGLLLFIRMLSGRRHHIQHLNFSPKVGLVSSYRHDRELVDFNLAKSEVAKLHEAIEKNQLDHDDVVWILTTRNFFQLKATFVCYKQSYEVAIDQAINSSGNGDLGSILRGVILCIVSPEKHFAELLMSIIFLYCMIHHQVIRASTVGYWTKDEDSLTRAIVTQAEIDMTKIKGEYFKMNNTSLDDVVRRDASGVYKSFLMALIGAKI